MNLTQNFAFTSLLSGIIIAGLLGCSKTQQEQERGETNTSPTPPASVKRIFVTSVTYNGNRGGLSGADEICNNHASGANLGGTWKAWLSDSNTNAIDRIQDVGPWYLVDKVTKVFNNKANLATTPIVSISTNELGNKVNNGLGIEVWTGTLTGGKKATPAVQKLCVALSDWQSGSDSVGGAIGHSGAVLSIWTSYSQTSCSSGAAFYCIEQ